jgi:hypothetical protein
MTSSVTNRRDHGRGEENGWWLRKDLDMEGGRVQRGKERGREREIRGREAKQTVEKGKEEGGE